MCGKIGREGNRQFFTICWKRTMANLLRVKNVHYGKITVGLTHHSPTFEVSTNSEDTN